MKKMMRGGGYATLLFLILLVNPSRANAGPYAPGSWRWLQVGSTSSPQRALCYRPVKETGDLVILLHGWRQKALSWKKETGVAQLAEKYGVIVLAPEMGTCNYMDRYYPETHSVMRWSPVPGAVWMKQRFLPWIKRRFNPGKLYIAGVSTGARGALVTGQRVGGFAGVGYISGDWDIIKDDGNLYRLSLGPLKQFRMRWEANDTSRHAAALKGARVFMAHSSDDRITPSWQTALMKQDLDRLGVVNHLIIDNSGGHTWKYWNSRLEPMFRYWRGKK